MYTPVLPRMMGTEEELAIMINGSDKVPRLQPFLHGYHPNNLGFMTNGYRAYVDKHHFEIATPECADPDELTTYVLASQELVLEGLKAYIANRSTQDDGNVTAILNHRVVDAHGNSWGSHDNFHLTAGLYARLQNKESQEVAILCGHLASRSFVSGAGLVTFAGLNFSQKNHHIDGVSSYGHNSYHYRTDVTDDPRLEIRSNDVNILPWAIRTRIGSTALLLAVLQTPHRKRLLQLPADEVIGTTYLMNHLRLNADGTIKPSRSLHQAVENQQMLAQAALELDLPPAYKEVACELQKYCDDTEKVLQGDATIELLADRSDVAAKFSKILSRYNDDKRSGKPRQLEDAVSRAQDIMYDRYMLSAAEGEIVSLKPGWGYLLRHQADAAYSPDSTAIQTAVIRAPHSTRAHLRASLFQEHENANGSWQKVVYKVGAQTVHATLPANAIDLSDIKYD